MGRGKKSRGMRGNRGKMVVRRVGMREGKGGEGRRENKGKMAVRRDGIGEGKGGMRGKRGRKVVRRG